MLAPPNKKNILNEEKERKKKRKTLLKRGLREKCAHTGSLLFLNCVQRVIKLCKFCAK